jgi:hypothetical protein
MDAAHETPIRDMRIVPVAAVIASILVAWHEDLFTFALAAHVVLPFLVFALWSRRPWPPLGLTVLATLTAQWMAWFWAIAVRAHHAQLDDNARRIAGEGITLVFIGLVVLSVTFPLFCIIATGACAGVRWLVTR